MAITQYEIQQGNYMDRSQAIAFLQHSYVSLARQTDLSPNNPQVNSTLGKLIISLAEWQRRGFGSDLADDPSLAEVSIGMPLLCNRAECEMEKWWCRRILADSCPALQSLAAFWYLDGYRALHTAEIKLLGDDNATHFTFLGSGALPITAILLAQNLNEARIRCIDCDAEACELAERLIAVLGLSEQINIQQTLAENYFSVPGDIAICASLLHAPALFSRLKQAKAERLIVRDAEGPYRFCYRPAQLPGEGYIERAKSPLSPERINTSRYFEAI